MEKRQSTSGTKSWSTIAGSSAKHKAAGRPGVPKSSDHVVYLRCLRAVENKPSHPRMQTLASQGAREYCQTAFREGLPRERLVERTNCNELARRSPTTHRESKFRRSLPVDLIRIALRLLRRNSLHDTNQVA